MENKVKLSVLLPMVVSGELRQELAPIKISILIFTYNLKNYIEKALNSVLTQEHTYSYEIVVCDDCSTDGTRDILLQYQKQYPAIKLILQQTNVGLSKNYLTGLKACRGEYIAMLDGDDYWTDNLKLQKQIQYLDNHSDYALSCHRYKKYFQQEGRFEDDPYLILYISNSDGFEIDPEKFFTYWVTQTLTIVLRKSALDLQEFETYPHFKDTHIFFSLLQKGKGYAHNFFGGVYTIHQAGDWNKKNSEEKWKIDYLTIAELLKRYKNDKPLQRTYALYRYGLWEFGYKEACSTMYRFPWLRLRVHVLKFRLWFNNPYVGITGKEINPMLPIVVSDEPRQDLTPIKISILIFTYNLKNYIEKALNSVLAQEHTYSYEIVVCDDCSTDGTRDILLQYRQQYPFIKLILQQTNVGLSKNYLTGLKACRGEYIAMLDGDDYWTDSLKLQKQIQFLDDHSDYVLSCHRYKKYFQREDRFEDVSHVLYVSNPDGFEIDSEKFFTRWITQTLTIVLRTNALDVKEFETYPNFKDTHIFFSALQKGKGYAHGFFGGVYTIHQAGDWNKKNPEEKWKIDYLAIRELFKRYRSNRTIQITHAIYYYGLLEFEYSRLRKSNKFYLYPSIQWIKLKIKRHNPYGKELDQEYLAKNSDIMASPASMLKDPVKISVLMVTYNQEIFINKALDSVLEQQHSYPYEIVIGDDYSTDNTRSILLDYQRKYPDIIKLLFHGGNVGASRNYLKTLELCRGEYIAMLDGDDYWTDPDKLQKQITFLDNNPEFVISTHRFKRYYVHDGYYKDDLYPEIYEQHPEGLVIEPDKFFLYWVAQTLTVVFRRSAADLAEFKTYQHFDDMHLFFCVFQKGKGYAHGFFGGVYNVHEGGVWNKLNMRNKWRINLILSNELLKNYPNNKALKLANATFRYELLKCEYHDAVSSCRYPTLSRKVSSLKKKMNANYPYPMQSLVVKQQHQNAIKVSVLMVTYNHKQYLAKALDSILEQRHDYVIEIIIGDDCSTDGTRDIMFAYQEKYPEIIKLILNSANIGPSRNYRQVLEACKGDYIAMLDGDDYWTDPLKLQTQVSFLDSNPEFVLSSHRFKRYYKNGDRYEDDFWPELYTTNTDGFVIDPEFFFSHWVTQTLTVVFRRDKVDLDELRTYQHFGDVHLFFSVLQKGKGYSHDFFGAVYNFHNNGIWSKLNEHQRWLSSFTIISELIQNYKNSEPLRQTFLIYRFGHYKFEYEEIYAKYKMPYFVPKLYWLKAKVFLYNPYRNPDSNPILKKLSLNLTNQKLFSDGPKKFSVLVVTYNHEKFIAKALDSILEQQHPYSFEIVIGDDFSTDDTRAILFDYQRRFPQYIKLILHSANIGASKNYLETLQACRGEYIAMLDGDDYWTDTRKIQKQIQFLEDNPDFVLSTHRFKRNYLSDDRLEDDLCPALFEGISDGFEMDPNKFFTHWLCQTLTVVFRSSAVNLLEFKTYHYFDDIQLFFCLLQRGKGYAHSFYGGIYNIHQAGVWSKLDERDKWLSNLLPARELLKNYKTNRPLKRAYKIYYYEFLKIEYRKTVASYKYPFLIPKVHGLGVSMYLKNPYIGDYVNFWRST